MPSPLHQPLKTSRSIRVLQILPGAPESELRLHISEIDLDHTHPYHAISYTWGDDLATTTIHIDDEPFEVRQNLFGFLRQLRAQSYASDLWVDAISIRQDDLVEKGQQVGMIGDIFKRAERVLVWVGEHADSTEALFRRLSSAQWRQRPHTPEESNRRLQAWISFMARPYFRRLWIVQEVVLAHDVMLHCGESSVVWSRLAKLLHVKYSTYVVDGFDWDGVDFRPAKGALDNRLRRLPRLVRMRDLLSNKSAWSRVKTCVRTPWTGGLKSEITDFLSMVFIDHLCSEPRDYVYALLSLEQSPKLHSFKPDYTMNEAELFIHFCATKLCHCPRIPRSYSSFTGRGQGETEIMIRRLGYRLLNRIDSVHKAIRIGEHLYNDSGTSKQERRALDYLLGLLKSETF